MPLMVVVTVGVLFGAAGGGGEDQGSFVFAAFMRERELVAVA